jgi:hypothetical protein
LKRATKPLRGIRIVVEHAEAGLRVPSVTEHPEVVLYNWEVHEMHDGRWLLSGCLANGSLRTCTPVARSAHALVCRPESRRFYRLIRPFARGYEVPAPLIADACSVLHRPLDDISDARIACAIRRGLSGAASHSGRTVRASIASHRDD